MFYLFIVIDLISVTNSLCLSDWNVLILKAETLPIEQSLDSLAD